MSVLLLCLLVLLEKVLQLLVFLHEHSVDLKIMLQRVRLHL